jgi:hypothetical protein
MDGVICMVNEWELGAKDASGSACRSTWVLMDKVGKRTSRNK